MNWRNCPFAYVSWPVVELEAQIERGGSRLRALKVFGDLTRAGGRLGFYTKFTSDRIPAVEGCYAWFLPLWIYREDLNELLDVVNRVIRYEPDPEQAASAPFNWENIELKVRRDVKARVTDTKEALWSGLIAEDGGRNALEQVLLEASVLMPPLYVGRTKNLQRRYVEHIDANHERFNDFHHRFTDCVRRTRLPLSVEDLLFVCVRTAGQFDSTGMKSDEIDALLEQILMQICRPPFSLK